MSSTCSTCHTSFFILSLIICKLNNEDMKRQWQTDIWIIISFGTSSQKSSTILKWNKPNMKCFLFSLKMIQTQLHKSLDQLINLLISFVQNSKATKLQRNVEIPLLRCWMYTLEHLWLSQTGLSPTRSNNKHNKHRVTKCFAFWIKHLGTYVSCESLLLYP